MNLLEHDLWRKTKIWLAVSAPIFVVFLFIQPYVALFVLFIVVGRFVYVEFVKLLFEKLAEKSHDEENLRLDEIVNNIRRAIREDKRTKSQDDEIDPKI